MTPTMEDILLAVQRVTGVGVRAIKGKRQQITANRARDLAYFVGSQCFNHSFCEIARATDRSSKTVSNAVYKLIKATYCAPEIVDRIEEQAISICAARQAGCAIFVAPIYAPINTREKADA